MIKVSDTFYVRYDSYNYNYKNQLYQTNTGAYFGYDASGQRVRATLSGTTTLYPTQQYNTDGTTAQKHILTPNGTTLATVKGTGSSAAIYYTHTDHLTGSSVVSTSTGAQEQLLDYYPYGEARLNQQAGTFNEQKQYIGQVYDANIGLNYLNARYYNANIGRFISQDPIYWVVIPELLADPQQLNAYSYGRNNPLTWSDPSGLLNIIIPGTGYDTDTWSTSDSNALYKNVSETFGGTTWVYNDKSRWSGKDNDGARYLGASNLKHDISDYSFAPGEELNIIGHSHGGNVGYILSQIIDRKIDTLITIGTPARNDYQPNYANIGQHINAYSNDDQIQNHGGGSSSVSGWVGRLLFGKSGGKVGNILGYGEFGRASRTKAEATNIDMSGETKWWNPRTSHSKLWQKQSVWDSIRSNIK